MPFGLHTSEQASWLAAIIESSSDAIIGKDLNGIVESWNGSAEKLYGYPRDEMIGRSMRILLPPERADEEEKILEQIRAGNRIDHFETTRVRKDGRRLTISLTISPICSSAGVVVGASHVARDLSEQKQYEHTASQLAAIVESSEDAIISKSVNGIIESWNAGAERLYGYTAEQSIGRSVLMLLPPDRIDEEARIVAKILAGERLAPFETVRRRADGRDVSVSLAVSPIRNSRGEIVGASHVARDVTDRSAYERATAQLAAIVESSEDAIIGKTLDGIILTWNASAERVYGYSAEEVKWRPMSMLIPPDRSGEESTILARIRAGDRVEHFETVRVRKDGKNIDVSLTISPIRNSAGQIIGASHVARDISERREFERRMLQTQKLESLGLLAGGVAHDFNNLLTGILGNAALAADQVEADDPVAARLGDVVRAAERASELTRQLLAYAGKGYHTSEHIDLSSLVREIGKLVEASIPKHVHLRLELQNVPPIIGDPGQIQQVIMNLIINGAEAIGEAGSVIVRTFVHEIRASEPHDFDPSSITAGAYVTLQVHDTGCGMTEETLARIFDPFFTTKRTGRGLGLAAVAGIIRSHGGSLKIYSQPGKGSTFKVLLPVSTKPQPPRELTPSTAVNLNGRGSVLIVDDEPVIRTFAQAALTHYGYSVRVAANGKEALEIFARTPADFHLICLDLTMPVISGEETFTRLQAIRNDVPVLLCSGLSEAEALERFEGKGISGFLQKPYSGKRLAERVKAAIRLKS